MKDKTVSHYRILEKLGEGGMGVVYKARDTKLNRDVALKFLSSHLTANEDAKKRFTREARAASSLDHPNISVIHEIGETDDGHSFICMGYYEGQTLREKLEQDPPDPEAAVSIIIQIARGLQRAHDAGIIHRDIKPANIILTDQGDVKIVDFGLAKLVSETAITETDGRGGTLAYMSPEQLHGEKVDYRTDLYSLGVLMYEMLSGRRPYHEEHYAALMYSIVNTDPPPPSVINPSVPKELDQLVLKLIHKRPEDRWQSANEVIAFLDKTRERSPDPVPAQATARSTFFSKPAFIIPALIAVLAVTALSIPFIRGPVFQFINQSQTPGSVHLVVLPFVNVGDDPDNRAFADGLMETLTSSLTFIQPGNISYWVVSSSEVRQRNIESASDALREFNATHAVYGSVHRLANQLRLTLNLVDTKTSRQIKSQMITMPLDSLPRLQDEAMLTLAQMLEIDIPSEREVYQWAGGTVNSRSYEYYLEGRGYLSNYQNVDNIHTSIALFESAVDLDPDFALAYAGIGEAYWRLYNETRNISWVEYAEDSINRAMESDSSHPTVLVTMGMIQSGRGYVEESIRTYQKALEMNPTHADAYRGLANAYEQLGHFDEAEETLKRAIRLIPTYWAGYNQLGAFYLNQGRMEDAIPQFEKVIELIPNSNFGYINLGVTYYYLDKYQEAIEMFNRVIEIEPNYVIYSNLGTLHYYEANFEKAAQMYQNALEISDRDYRIWGHLASALRWSGAEDTKVNEHYRKALQIAEDEKSINPRDPMLLVSMAGFKASLEEYTLAEDYLQQALRISPDNATVLGYSGRIYEKIGQRERALSLIKSALDSGYSYLEISNDPDLAGLRDDPDFRELSQQFSRND